MEYKKIKLKDGSTIDEHRLIAGVSGFDNVVHHIDEDIRNNSPDNLEIMSRSEHCKLHGFGLRIRPVPIFKPDDNDMAICKICGRLLDWVEFKKDKNYSHGRDPRCKDCFNRIRREQRAKSR